MCSPPKNTRADTHKIQKNLPRCRPISPGDDKSCAGKPLSFIRWRQSTRANCVRISWSKASQNGASKQDSKKWLGGSIGPPFRELLVTILETFSDQREKVKPVLSLQSEPSREGSGGSLFLQFVVLESGPLPRPPQRCFFPILTSFWPPEWPPKSTKKM